MARMTPPKLCVAAADAKEEGDVCAGLDHDFIALPCTTACALDVMHHKRLKLLSHQLNSKCIWVILCICALLTYS